MTEVSESLPPLCACTAATVAELPAARVAAASFRAEHPGSRFVILLVDGVADGPDLLTPTDIGVDEEELARLATAYTAEQTRAVLRPRLLESLLAEGGPVLYLAPHVLVLDSVAEVVAAGLRRAGVVLVPRVLRPLPDDGLRPAQEELRAVGVYDPGFLAVAPGTGPFLRAWAEHSRRDPDTADGFLDGVPAMIDHHVIRDDGVGLSVWNAGQRKLSGGVAGPITVGDSVLRTVHFDGFDPARPWLLSAEITERPRALLSEHPLLEQLCADYRARLVGADAPAPAGTSPFGRLRNDTVLPAGLRQWFREDWLAALRERTDPPAPATAETAFLRWACAPVDGLPGSTKWSFALWRDDPALRQRFPEPFGEHAAQFRDWCEAEGVSTRRLHPAAVPVPHGREIPLRDQLGVSVLGDGPLAERVRLAANASGVPVSAEPAYPVVLCCGDVADLPQRRQVIALRERRVAVPADVDELWVPWPMVDDGSDPGVPEWSLVLPVLDPGAREERERLEALARFGVGDGPVFTGFVDHGIAACQNATDVLDAFDTAFADRSDVTLLLAVRSAAEYPERAERLRLAVARDRRIRLVEAESEHRFAADAADWFVLLHESACPATELSEAAVRGVPVITANVGAAAELFDQDSAVFVSQVDGRDASRIADAAAAMRELASDVAVAEKLGSAARARVLAKCSVHESAAQLRERVEHAYRNWRARHAANRLDGEADPLQPLLAARHALLRRPDVGDSYKTPMAPALRRAVLRVLDHYDRHLRTVMGSMMDGVERATAELLRRQDELAVSMPVLPENTGQLDHDPRVDRLVTALDTAMRRIDTLEARLSEQGGERDDRLAAGMHAANQALRASDALRRVVVRQHERMHQEPDGDLPPSSLVLCDAGMLRLPASDAIMLPVLSSNGVWEPDVADAIDSLIEPGGFFLDVGAYVGYHTLRVLTRLGGSVPVVAVEPSAGALGLLRHNVAANVVGPVAESLFVVEAAAWDTSGELVAEPALSGGVGVWPAPEGGDGPDEARSKVRAVRLDRELEGMTSLNGLRLTVAKVDVPGRGHRALGGLVRLLRRDRPHVICSFAEPAMTEFGDDPMAALREFATWGYEVAFLGRQRACPLEEVAEALADGTERNLWLRPLTSRFDIGHRHD